MVTESFQAIGEALSHLNKNAGGGAIAIVETDPYGVEKTDTALSIITLPLRTLLCLDRLRGAIRMARSRREPAEIQPSVLTFAGGELHANCELYSGDLLVDGESRAYLTQEEARGQLRLGEGVLRFAHIHLSDWDKVRCKGCIAEVDEYSVRLKFWEAGSNQEMYYDLDRSDMDLVTNLAESKGLALPVF